MMQRLKVSVPILFLFCFFIHPVMLKGLGTISYAYIYGIPAFYLLLNIRCFRRMTFRQCIILEVAVVLIILSFVYPAIHNTSDYSYLKVSTYFFRKLLIYVFLIKVLVNHYGEETTTSHFMYYFSLVHAAYVIGTLLFVFVPGLKNAWFSVFEEVIESEEYLQSFGYTFRIGWQGFSGYAFTIFCTISCLFLMYLYYGRNREIELEPIQFFVPFVLSFAGNMFYGRSGLVVSIVGCLVALIIWNRKHFYSVLKAGGIVAIIVLLVYSLRNVAFFSDWYRWMSSPIINLIKTGSFNNVSINRTHEMVFMPDFKTIIWGDGYFMQDGHYYMRTDSGIMRNVLFWGIVGVIITYGLTIYSLIELKKRDILLFLLILGSFIAFEYKGHVYYEFVSLMAAMAFVETLRRPKRILSYKR